MSEYNVGTPVRLTATFTWDGGPADPTAVVLRVCGPIRARLPNMWDQPSAVTHTYGVGTEIVKDGPGVYHFDLTVTDPGLYYFQWEGTGAVPVWSERQLTFKAKQLIK